MSESEIRQIMDRLTVLGSKIDTMKDTLTEIKEGKLAICQLHEAAIKRIETKLDRLDRGEGRANAEASGEREGAKLEVLRGLFSISNISSNKIVAVAKVGRDLVVGATLVWLVLKILSAHSIGPMEHSQSAPVDAGGAIVAGDARS